jgi:hypothetical protein
VKEMACLLLIFNCSFIGNSQRVMRSFNPAPQKYCRCDSIQLNESEIDSIIVKLEKINSFIYTVDTIPYNEIRSDFYSYQIEEIYKDSTGKIYKIGIGFGSVSWDYYYFQNGIMIKAISEVVKMDDFNWFYSNPPWNKESINYIMQTYRERSKEYYFTKEDNNISDVKLNKLAKSDSMYVAFIKHLKKGKYLILKYQIK